MIRTRRRAHRFQSEPIVTGTDILAVVLVALGAGFFGFALRGLVDWIW